MILPRAALLLRNIGRKRGAALFRIMVTSVFIDLLLSFATASPMIK
jgi:hypothetical protein